MGFLGSIPLPFSGFPQDRSTPTSRLMGKDMEGIFRLRVFFEDHRLLNNSQLSDGLGRCWVLLKPSIVTIDDLASHLREKFAIPNCLVIFIDDFVLPPFESIRILNAKDIIRVKLKDALLPSDCQNVVQDPQIARECGLPFQNNLMPDRKSQANSQENGNNENAVYGSNLSLNIGMLEQKKEHSLELCDSISKRQKLNCTRKQVTSIGVQDIHSWQNRNLCHVNVGSKMELPGKDKAHDDGLVVSQLVSEDSVGDTSISEVSLGEPSISEVSLGGPSSSRPCKVRQQFEGMNSALKSESDIVCDVTTKEYVQSSAAATKNDQHQFTAMAFKGRHFCSDVNKKNSNDFCMENHPWLDRKLEGDSPENKAKTAKHKIDFATLFPLTRSPLKGDIVAYRYVEPSSMSYPVLSSPQVGKVKSFDHKSSEIVLIQAPEFEIFLEENPKTPISTQKSSPYKEDGSLKIKLAALIDVRLLKAHNLKELACLPRETLDRTEKDKWELALATSDRNQSDAQQTAQKIGWDSWIPNNSTNTPSPSWPYKESNTFPRDMGRASASRLNGASPAGAFFWETVLSKGAFGKKGAKCFSSGKY